MEETQEVYKSVQRYESGPFALKGSSGPDAPRQAQVI